MSTVETGLYGTHPTLPHQEEGGYESPAEYADQGDVRVVRNLQFSYLAATTGLDNNQVLTPIDLPRDSEVNVDQIGLLALQRGEKHHEFYTTAELEALRRPAQSDAAVQAAITSGDLSELGEYELAEWIKETQPTINDVLEHVGEDKEFAHRMLQAENIATDGEPRRGLEEGLSRIIGS